MEDHYKDFENRVVCDMFNGGHFDFGLICSTLLSMHRNPQVVMGGASNIMYMTFQEEKFCFVDHAKFASGSLATVYNSILKSPLIDSMYLSKGKVLPPTGKYAAFPFGVISTEYFDRLLPFSDLLDDTLWRNKDCEIGDMNISLGQRNCAWWQATFGLQEYFDVNAEILKYNCADSGILQVLAEVHYTHRAFGEHNGKKFATNKAFTTASHCVGILQQCFLEEGCEPRGFPQQLPIGMKISMDGKDWFPTLHDVVRGAFRGGKTFNNIRLYERPSNFWDINSSYPAVMLEPLPICYDKHEVYAESRPFSEVDFDHNSIYVADIQMHEAEGLTVSAGGYTLDPLHIPCVYHDPTRGKRKPRMVSYYGVELKTMAEHGAQIKVHAKVDFISHPIMNKYVRYMYDRRVLYGDGKDPVTFEQVRAPDPVAKADAKNDMNMLFGKFGQSAFGITKAVDNYEALIAVATLGAIVNIEVLKTDAGYNVLLVTVMVEKAHIGECVAVAGRVLAGGRDRLVQFTLDARACKVAGTLEPVAEICGDTDSVCIPQLHDDDTSRAFAEKYFHNNKLGYFKQENKNPFLKVMSAGKKMYFAKGNGEKDKIASKGVPPKMLKEHHFDAMLNSESVVIPLKVSFEHNAGGVRERLGCCRRLCMKNDTRVWHANGTSSPHESLDSFMLGKFGNAYIHSSQIVISKA